MVAVDAVAGVIGRLADVLVGGDACCGATDKNLCRFDTSRNLIEEKPIRVEGVNHLGAVDYHDGFIWAGLLNNGQTGGRHDPELDRSIIAKIRAKDLAVVETRDITRDGVFRYPAAMQSCAGCSFRSRSAMP